MLEITIPMRPVAKGRPRFSGSHCYTPEATKIAEDAIAWAVKSHMQKEGIPMATGPVLLTIWFSFKLPSNATKAEKEIVADGGFHHIKRPDLDNLVKLVSDSLNKVAYADDVQVAHIDACKIYGEHDFIKIELTEISI